MRPNTPLTTWKHHSGYLTLELLLALLLSAIWITCSLHRTPSISQAVEPLYHLLTEARLLAVTQQQNVRVYPIQHDMITALGNTIYHRTKLPADIPISWHASLGYHQQVVFTPHSGTDGEQGHFTIGCQKPHACYYITINYSGHIRITSP